MMKIIRKLWRDLRTQREKDLENLICHAWMYSNYPNCGRSKMTSDEKRLYDEVIERQTADV